jgi:WD40 repeat protein
MAAVARLDVPKPVSDDEGPYLGLHSYEERHADRFFGREESVTELARMVKRGPITVVFGVSGIGKSSVLQAGLFPQLRAEDYLPIWIRLDFSGRQRDLCAQVKERIEQELTTWRVDSLPPDKASLAHYFARNPLWSSRNRLLTPLLVFDQLEEIFTIGREHASSIAELIKQIAELVDVDVDLFDDDQDVPPTPKPRVVFSLREEFLAHLETFRKQIPDIALNRYRLTRMTGAQALRAIEQPAGAAVSHEVAKQIVQFVVTAGETESAMGSNELATLEVEPALLSLVCHELDRRRRELGNSEITAALIADQSGRIVERFYDRAFAGLPDSLRSLVEEHLITAAGYRTTMALAAALELDGVTEAGIEKLVERRILRSETRFGAPHIELVHDRLTKIATQGRARRREAEREKERIRRSRRTMKIVAAVAASVVLLVALAVLVWTTTVRVRSQKELAARLVEKNLRDAYLALLTRDPGAANKALSEADRELRRAHLRPPAELNLLRARAAAENELTPTHYWRSTVSSVRFTAAGQLVTYGRDQGIWVDNKPWFAADGSLTASSRPATGAVAGRSLGPSLRLETVGVSPRAADWIISMDGTQVIADGITAKKTLTFALPEPQAAKQLKDKLTAARKLDWHVCVAPDNKAFAVWRDTQIVQWSLPEGTRTEHKTSSVIEDLVCLDEARLLVHEKARLAILPGANNGSTVGELPLPMSQVAASQNGQLVVAASSYEMAAWKHATDSWGRDSAQIDIPVGPNQLEISGDAKHVLVTSRSRETNRVLVTVWGVDRFELEFAVERSDGFARWTRDGSKLLVVSPGTVEVWDSKDWRPWGQLHADLELDPRLFDAIAVGDTLRVATRREPLTTVWTITSKPTQWHVHASADASIGFWQVMPRQTQEPLLGTPAPGESKSEESPALRSLFATLHADGTVTLDSTDTHQSTTVHVSKVHDIRWTSDGELLTLGRDSVDVWSSDGTPLASAPGCALAAAYGKQPTPILWTCDELACTAWDVRDNKHSERRARLAIKTLVDAQVPISISADLKTLRMRDLAYLLPPVGRANPVAANGVKALSSDPTLLVEDGDGSIYSIAARGVEQLATRVTAGVATFSGLAAYAHDATLALMGDSRGQPTAPRDSRIVALNWGADRALAVAASPFAVWRLSERDTSLGAPAIAMEAFHDLIPKGLVATLSPDGRRVATAMMNGTIDVRDADRRTATPRSYTGAFGVRSLYMSRVRDDGEQTIVARTRDGLAVWDRQGPPTQIWFGNYHDARLDADGRHLVALTGRTAVLFEIENSKLLQRTTLQADGVDLSDDGKKLAVVDLRRTNVLVQAWDGKKLVDRPYQGYDTEIRFQTGGGKVLWLRGDRMLIDTATGASKAIPNADSCIFGGTGELIACVVQEDLLELQLFKISDATKVGHALELRQAPSYFIYSSAFDDPRVTLGLVYDAFSEVVTWKSPDAKPERLKLASDLADLRWIGDALLTITGDGQTRWVRGTSMESQGGARVLDVAAGPPVRVAIDNPERGVTVFHPGGSDAADECTGTKRTHLIGTKAIACVDAATDSMLHVKLLGSSTAATDLRLDAPITSLLASGDQLVVGLDNGHLLVVNADASFTELQDSLASSGSKASIRALALDQTKRWLASGADDGTFSIWRMSDGRELVRVHAMSRTRGAMALAFAPGDPAPALFTGGPDGEVVRWELGVPMQGKH